MSDNLLILEEPSLEFNLHQHLIDPHDGLMLFGPYGAATDSHPKSLPYGLIGTEEGMSAFRDWSHAMNRALVVDEERDRQGFKKPNVKLWPAFPCRARPGRCADFAEEARASPVPPRCPAHNTLWARPILRDRRTAGRA